MYVVGIPALLANVIGTYRDGERTLSQRLALVLGTYFWLTFPVRWAYHPWFGALRVRIVLWWYCKYREILLVLLRQSRT